MGRIYSWLILWVIVGLILVVLFLLRPLFRKVNKGKYVIYEGSLITRKDIKDLEQFKGPIDESELIELTEQTANQLNAADAKWHKENYQLLKQRGYV
jgi:hypothetical protein